MTMNIDDKQLMVQVSAGDQQAFATLAEKYSAPLLHFCYATTKNEELARDILQLVLIAWWQKAASWNNKKGALTTWLHRIAYNKCMDALRQKSNKINEEFDEKHHDTSENLTAEDGMISAEIRLKIGNAILNLPDNQRIAMLLTYYEDYANADVAKKMDTSVKAVESLLVRARKTLKQNLGEAQI